jgi:hypothetical protein
VGLQPYKAPISAPIRDAMEYRRFEIHAAGSTLIELLVVGLNFQLNELYLDHVQTLIQPSPAAVTRLR